MRTIRVVMAVTCEDESQLELWLDKCEDIAGEFGCDVCDCETEDTTA